MPKIKYWIPTVIWMIVIFFLSGRTPGQLHNLFPFIQNFNPGHLIAYFILGLLSYYSISKSSPEAPHFYWVLLIAFLYGISDEFHQSFVPGRTPDIMDLTNDVIGALAAALLIRAWQRRKNPENEDEEPQETTDTKN